MGYVIFQTESKQLLSFPDGLTVIYGDYEEAKNDCKEGEIILPISLEMGETYKIGDKVEFTNLENETFVGTISKILVFDLQKEYSDIPTPYKRIFTNTLRKGVDFSLTFDDIGMWCRSSDIVKKL